MNPLAKGKYLVGGLGVTGLALIDFLLTQGVDILGFEELSETAFLSAKEKYESQGVPFYFKELPNVVLKNCQTVFLSPGVPPTRAWIQEAKQKKIPVMGELELASRYLDGSIIAVTGTNGKSTTVSLLHSILNSGGYKTSLKGNIGSPLITAVSELPRDFHVVEVSSYQLETIETFHPKISVILNVTDDHFDRHPSLEEYANTKGRIFMNQNEGDFLIINTDDPYCYRLAKKASAKVIPFSLVNHFQEGGFVDNHEMVIRLFDVETRYLLDACSLEGLHNQENMLVALLASTLLGVKEETIKNALKNFQPLRHRLEKIGTYRGLTFYDDSKGTNVGAVVMSLASFEKNVILILGGRDKGGNYAPLKPLIEGKGKGVILMGEARHMIARALEKTKPLYLVSTMEEAVAKSYELGSPGDIVLLSPACSSFDQYKNYAERGDDFKKWVLLRSS